MKATCSIIAAFAIAMTMTACSAGSDNEINNNVDATLTSETTSSVSLSTLKSNYGAEVTTSSDSIPTVTKEKAQSVLEALKASNNTMKSNIVTNNQTSTEKTRKVIMNAEYQATTRGSVIDKFELSVVLNFSEDNSIIYYWGSNYNYTSNTFKWSSNSMTLAPVVNSNGYTYSFESTGYLYFKLYDENNTVIKVPVTFKGTHDFNTDKGTYCFQLVKCN
jgi:hypothetical protein